MAKFKLKTNKSASKRFKFTKNNHVKRSTANRSHILTKKSRKCVKNYTKNAIVIYLTTNKVL